MKKRSLKTQLSLAIALVSLISVALISLLSNLLINQQFKQYISGQQSQKALELISSVSLLHDDHTNQWDIPFIHTIGMNALYDGYIMKVYDEDGTTVWDAEECDMSLCDKVMSDIVERMKTKYPRINGEFISNDYNLEHNGEIIGTVNLSYYGPFFLSEGDFGFLSSLNSILLSTGILALLFSIIIGWALAKKISRPISKTIDIAKQISEGDYDISFEGQTKTKELEALVTSINQLAHSLNEQERLRKQLTADVSHELRTPLTSICTHLEAMIEGLWEPSKERLQSCYEEISRMSHLVKDLECLAKSESENLKLNKTDVDMMQVIQTATRNFESELKHKNIDLQIEGTKAYAYVDKERIIQVVLNLLSNAIKYTPSNGKISITLEEIEHEVIFSIEDNGIGIEQKDLPYIFERFYRTEKSRNRRTGGAGIGLAIVKSILNANGGKIEVQSKIGMGSCFRVTLYKRVGNEI